MTARIRCFLRASGKTASLAAAEPAGIWPRERVPTRREAAREKFATLLEQATSDL